MKLKLLIILLTLSTLGHLKSFGQSTPVNPVASTTNSAYYEPSTKRIWNYYGNYGWRTFVDSLRLYKILNSYQLKLGYVPVNQGGDAMRGALASNQSVGSILDQTNRSRTFQVLSPFGNDPAFSLEMNYGNISLGEVASVWRYGMHYPDFNFYRTRYDESGQANQSYMFYDTYNLKFGIGLSYTRDSLTKVWTLNAQSPDLSGYAKLNGGNTFNGTQQFGGLVNIHTLTFGTVGQINDVVPNLDFSHLHYDDGNGLVVDGGVPFVLTNATGSFKFRPIGNSLYLTDPAITMGMYFQGNDLYDINGKKVLKTGDAPTTADLNDYVKRTVGVIHLTDVPTMMAYTGPVTTVIVDAPNSGGTFVYTPNIVVTNYYNRLAATGKGTGAWVRQADMKGGVNPLWDYRIKADAIYNYTTLKATPGYTDNTPYLQQMINSVRQGAIHLRFQPTYPNYIGCANTLYVRSGTIIEGDESLFPLQVGTDSLKFPVMSGLYFEKGALTSATDSNYRMQRPIVKNIAIVGSGKNNGYAAYKALINKNFVGPSGTGTIHQDPGLPNFHNVTIAGFSVGYDLQTSNDTWIEGGLVQYCGIGFKGGRNGLRINTSDFFANDTIGIAKGAINNIHDCLFESGIHGLFVDSGYLSKVDNNTFKTFTYDGLTVKGNTGASQFNNNTFSGDMRHGIVLRNAGNNNAVQGNSFANFATSPLYITNTQKVFIDGNTIVAPANSNHPAIQADTSITPIIGFNNSIDYAYNRKFSATGSAHAANEILNSLLIKGSYAYNLYPGISTYHAGNDMYNPSLLPTGQITSAWNATEYIGTTAPGRTAYWTFETEEQQSTTAQGSSFNLYLTALGTATTKKTYSFLPSGLVFTNGTNSIKVGSQSNGSNSGLLIQPTGINQALQVNYKPSGNSGITSFGMANSSDPSNFGAGLVAVNGNTFYIAAQGVGTPPIPVTTLDLGGAGSGVGAASGITTVKLNGTNVTLPNQAASSIIKTDASKNLVPAVANTDYLPINNPSMTGTPSAPTATAGTNTTQLATTAFVQAAVAGDAKIVTAPTASTSAGTTGQIAMDANYFYWYAGGRWNRVPRDTTF